MVGKLPKSHTWAFSNQLAWTARVGPELLQTSFSSMLIISTRWKRSNSFRSSSSNPNNRSITALGNFNQNNRGPLRVSAAHDENKST